ncbi:MAG: S9 family peptidase [Planctomycetota bacterium]
MKHNACRWSLTLGALLVVAAIAVADPPARDHDITVDDYFTIGVMTGLAASPDGKLVAYTESRWEPPADKRNVDLWVVEVATRVVRRLTFERTNDANPQWSADSQHIYFTSNVKRGDEKEPPFDGKTQVWRVGPQGGDPQPVTRVTGGIGLYQLASDGKSLYYTTQTEVVDDEWKDLRASHKGLKYGHGVTQFSQLWRLDLVNWRAEKLIDEKRVIGAFQVSNDERRIAMITKPDEELIVNEGWSRVDVYDTATKKITTVTTDGWRAAHESPYGWIDGLSWADDGDALAFAVSFDGFPPRLYVSEYAGADAALSELTRPAGVTVAGAAISWRPGSRELCFHGEERARDRVYALPDVRAGKSGAAKVLTPGDVVISGFSFAARAGNLCAIVATPQHPHDLFEVAKNGTLNRLTTINPQIDTWKLPQISLVSWKGANGDEVEGILELPPDYKPGTPLPMVVELHGGPTAATQYYLQYWIYGRTLLPAKGYALLSPNYRGSTGYGDKFMTDLVGRENDIEVEDILKGVDAMIERGIADPERLAVMGWSNGGFLTNCLITKTDRFKGASSGAGVLDQVMQWGIEDTPGHVINYMKGALPWNGREIYREGSPLYDLDKVRTPTLIHVGEGDERVPAAHSQTLYRGLRHYLKVPVELIVYPGEGHGLTTYKHRKAKLEWDLAWFDRYVRTPEPKP